MIPELSMESRFADFLPAPSTVVNVAIAFTFFVTIQNCRTNPLTLAMNTFGDLFSSTKPKEILVQVSPNPTIEAPPTATVNHRYEPDPTSNILYTVAVCVAFVLVGAIFVVLRKKSTPYISPPLSSVNSRIDIGSTGQASDNGSSYIDIPDRFVSRSSNLAAALIDNNSDKNAPGFLEKFKMFLTLFFILTFFTHGGRITQKIRSLAIRDDPTFSYNNATATLKPYFHQASELVTTETAAHFDDFSEIFTGGNILVSDIVETLTFDILYSSTTTSSTLPAPSILSSHLSSGSNEKDDPISLLPLPTMTSNPIPPYPISLSLVTTTPSPTTTSSSKAALDVAFEYFKIFILFFFFCILTPILSFLMTVLPACIDHAQLSKAILADQREVVSIHFSSHELLLIKVSAESCREIQYQCQRGCSRD